MGPWINIQNDHWEHIADLGLLFLAGSDESPRIACISGDSLENMFRDFTAAAEQLNTGPPSAHTNKRLI